MVKPADFLQAPIPLQSLTEPPKQYPWENPPEIVEEADAIKYYLDKLANQDVMDDLAVLFDNKNLAISTFVDILTTVAVSTGKHTIDMKLLVSPVIHAFLKAAMLQYGIDAKDDEYDPKKDPSVREKERMKTAIQLAMAEAKRNKKTASNDPGVAVLEEVQQKLQEVDTAAESEVVEPEDMPEETASTAAKGLMARETK